MPLFRAVRPPVKSPVLPRTTKRAPTNVPYLVDNLWEWTRPEEYPSRRTAVFAAPTPELAAASQPPGADVVVCRLELPADWPVAQITRAPTRHDARYHPDGRALVRAVMTALGQDWLELSADQRGPEGRLFQPCLEKAEVEAVLAQSALLDANAIRVAVAFWGDVDLLTAETMSDPEGEVFFGSPCGGYDLLHH